MGGLGGAKVMVARETKEGFSGVTPYILVEGMVTFSCRLRGGAS